MAENEGTTETGDQAQPTGTGAPADEVTTLRSRAAGLDAKVTSLTKAEAAAKERASIAEQRLADYEAGKVGNDEALRAQVTRYEKELADARRETKLARIEAKFPEAFAELGEAAENLSDEKLASINTRLMGVKGDEEPPEPRGNNGPKDGTNDQAPADETADQVMERLKKMPVPWAR